jgi:hypothetical protein
MEDGAMTDEEKRQLLLEAKKEARKRVLSSYGHKILLVMIAVLGFETLTWLGELKGRKWHLKSAPGELIRSAVSLAVESDNPTLIPNEPCDVVSLKSYRTREELTATLQAQAEACVWAGFRGTVDQVRRKNHVLDLKTDPEVNLERYENFAKFVTQEANFATTKARSVRLYIGTKLADGNSVERDKYTPRKGTFYEPILRNLGDLVEPTLSEESPTYVIYQILWYASLLLSVGASSMLFILLLTSLPITNVEGYWTKRIGEILERFPALASRGIALPLLAGAIGVGAVTGVAAETQPGGQSRDYETYIGSSSWSQQIESWSLVINHDDRDNISGPTILPPVTAEILDQLKTIDGRTKKMGTTLGAATFKLDTISNQVEAARVDLSSARQTLKAVGDQVADGMTLTEALSSDVSELKGSVNLAQLTFEQVHQVVDVTSKNIGSHVKTTKGDTLQEVKRDEQQQETLFRTLAQSAESDPRGPIKRAFGRTHFYVGPAAKAAMEARFRDLEKEPTSEEQALLTVLDDMHKDVELRPLNSTRFKQQLRERLGKIIIPTKTPSSSSDARKLSSEQITLLMENNIRSLLRVCALSR